MRKKDTFVFNVDKCIIERSSDLPVEGSFSHTITQIEENFYVFGWSNTSSNNIYNYNLLTNEWKVFEDFKI